MYTCLKGKEEVKCQKGRLGDKREEDKCRSLRKWDQVSIHQNVSSMSARMFVVFIHWCMLSA